MEPEENKPMIKPEPLDELPFEEEKAQILSTELNGQIVEEKAKILSTENASELDDEVAEEFGVVLLHPPENANLSRLLFQQRRPREMKSCTGRAKKQVKHMELNYQSQTNGAEIDELDALYDGVYNGENLEKDETLLRHSIGFFNSGRFYMIPIQESYEMQRKMNRPKKVDVVAQNKMDDEKLAQLDSEPTSNPVRVAFTRAETEWQKKRREQSAQYKQQVFDNDPWINLNVRKSHVRQVFDGTIKDVENCKPAKLKSDSNLPVL